ncbi:MAG: hypothetical protein U0L09_00930 [Christensenellales bacterium]|nr:hypothetical protein [Christensenellales bacterium]
MNYRKKSFLNFLGSTASHLTTILMGVLLPRLYIVSYGSQVNGLLSGLNQLMVYLGLFEVGIGTMALQALYGPIARDDWNGINGVMSATRRYHRKTAVMYGATLLLLAFVYPVVVETGLSYSEVFACIVLSGVSGVVTFWTYGKFRIFLRADGRNYVLYNLTTVITLLTNISKIVLIANGLDVIAVLSAAAVLQIVPAAYLSIYVARYYPRMDFSVPPCYEAISQRNYTMIQQISTLIFRNTDALLLTLFCGLNTVSVYSVYRMITSHLENLIAVLQSSVGFALGQTFHVDRKRFIRQIDCYERIYSAVSFAVFSVTLYFMLPFMRLYTRGIEDVEYVDGKLALLFVAVSLLTTMRSPMLSTINYAGHFKQTAGRCIAESVINLVVSIAAILRFGIYGALIGTIAALFYRTNDIIIYANRVILKRSPLHTYSIYAENFALFLIFQWLYRWMRAPESYLEFFLYGTVVTTVTLGSFLGVHYARSSVLRAIVKKEIRKRFHKIR